MLNFYLAENIHALAETTDLMLLRETNSVYFENHSTNVHYSVGKVKESHLYIIL